MSATLSQIQAKLSEVEALRSDGLSMVLALALGRMDSDRDTRLAIVAKFSGYEREFWALVKVERELIASGRMPPTALRTESRFEAPVPVSATVTPAAPSDAQTMPRIGPRNDASAAPLPAGGDGF